VSFSAITGLAIVVLTGLFIQVPNLQQPLVPGRIDVSKLGPQVGQRVPDFNLKDQNGKQWTLQSIMGAKGAMLVFVRSADW
jgi:AhpC/TSA family